MTQAWNPFEHGLDCHTRAKMLSALKNSLSVLTGSSSNGSLPVRRESTASYPGDNDHAANADQDGGGYGRAAAPTTSTPTLTIGASVPRVKHTMARIRSMMRKLNPEVLDTLSYAATSKQVAELQKLLQDYVIPKDVLDAYALHDGQDTFSVPHTGENGENEGNTGFIYGLWWMSIEEIIEEYTFWRRLDVSNPPSPVASKKRNDIKGKGRQQHQTHTARVPSQDAFLFGSEMDPRTVRATMRSCPEGFVREEYSHPSWLPLLKDGYGNYIGIDLDPPTLSEDERIQLDSSRAPPILPARGQVIAFGREIDTKTVLWNGWGDSNAYDNLGGGGWARFLASFADDLSASPALHRYDRYRRDSSARGRTSDDDDDDAYRNASGGRQEQLGSHHAGTGLDWMDASPLYSGLGTIEALVDRSRRIWQSVGMPMPVSTPAQEIIPLVNGDAPPPFGPAEGHSGSTDRDRKPPPLTFSMPGTASEASREGVSPKSAPHPLETGRSISNPPSASSGFKSNPETSSTTNSRSAFMDGIDVSIGSDTSLPLGGDPNASTTALVQPEGDFKPPMSLEPSLILSPPSPKDNAEAFGPFPSMSSPVLETVDIEASNPTTPTTAQHPTSASPRKTVISPGPLSANSLASPARMSPGQAQRYAERQNIQQHQFEQRNASMDSGRRVSTSSTGSYGRSPASRRAKPPPPAMPLGLPTLEFGNGIWEQNDTLDGDTSSYGFEKQSFEVVVDAQR